MSINYQQLAQAGNFLSTLGGVVPSSPVQSQRREIISANGYQEAKDFRLDRGESIILLDANANIVYLKECDDIGKISLKVFDCKDITEQYSLQNTPANISKAEFEGLKQAMQEIKTLLTRGVNYGKHDVKQ